MSLPPIPQIMDTDLMLDVYTHKSLSFAGSPPNSEYGDTDRLALLGKSAFNLATAYILLSDQTLATDEEIKCRQEELVSEDNIELWLTGYRLRDRLRYSPDSAEIVKKHEESLQFWYTYVGAVFLRGGLEQVLPWISKLIRPDHDAPPVRAPGSSMGSAPTRISNTPAQPLVPPPPLPNTPSSNSEVSGLKLLALLNQTAVQKRVTITYNAESTGPPHAPTWTVRCYINGEERGIGTGTSQKKAKEAAASQTWNVMGW